jgi:phospho-N-acetylmuramoyl-pentapeptide-transferase
MDQLFTLNIIQAGVLALAVTAVLGPLAIPALRRLKFGQLVRDDGPARHLQKTGTPTMGGVIFLTGILLAGLLFAREYPEGLLVLGITIAYGLIGLLDDFLKVALKRSLGLRAREKLLGQILLAGLLATLAVSYGRGTDLVAPFSGYFIPGGISFELNWALYLAFAVFIVVGFANAINLTDGLDGLAAGTTAIAAVTFVAVALWADSPGVAIVMAAVAGGCVGFLFYNRYPARVFMGDTGSLALGGALGAAAVVTRTELLLVIVGGIFVLEVLSVMGQVFSFKVFGRRILRMSPLHHHFELGGWSEERVVHIFWAAALVFALVGVLSLYGLR